MPQEYGKHDRHNKHFSSHVLRNFLSVALLSLALVSGLASISNSQLELSGNVLAVESLPELLADPGVSIQKIADREDYRLYLMRKRGENFFVHTEMIDDVWEVVEIEVAH